MLKPVDETTDISVNRMKVILVPDDANIDRRCVVQEPRILRIFDNLAATTLLVQRSMPISIRDPIGYYA